MNYSELVDYINRIILLQDNIILFLKNDINYIIKNKIKDDKKIEDIFDKLLNLFQTEEVLTLFKRLCRYYYFINKELVVEYFYLYKEMYLDDDKILKK